MIFLSRTTAGLRHALAYAAALLAFLTACTAAAQYQRAPGVAAGIAVGIERGLIPGHFPIYAGAPGCGEFTSGRSEGLAMNALISLPSFFVDDFGASIRLGWLRTEEHFTGRPAEPFWAYDPARRAAVQIEREFQHTTTSQAATLEMLAGYRILGGLNMGIGPSIGYRFASDATQTDRLVNADGLIFDGEGSTRTMQDGEVLTPQPFMLGATAAGWYEARIGSGAALVAEISAAAPILSSVREMQWRSFSVRGSIGLTLDLYSSPVPDIVADANPPDTVPRQPEPLLNTPDTASTESGLGASIHLYGIDEHEQKTSTVTVPVIETILLRYFMLDLWLLPGGEMLLPSESLLQSAADADRFSSDSLVDLDFRSIQQHRLNIIGERLRKFPAATISLNFPAEAGLQRRQAEAAKEYLTEIWRIDPARIAITAQTLHGLDSLEYEQSGPHAWILSAEREITASVMFRSTTRAFISPVLKVEPLYQSDTGIRQWTIVLDHQGTQIGRYSSRTPDADREASNDWHPVYDQLTSDSTMLTATFMVEDLTGDEITVRSQAPLRMQARQRFVEHGTRTATGQEFFSYTFPAADSSSPDLQSAESDVIVEIAGEISNGMKVNVEGFVNDRMDPAESEQMELRIARLLAALNAALAARADHPRNVVMNSVLTNAGTNPHINGKRPDPGMIVIDMHDPRPGAGQ